jgi:hypothetical protein
MGFRIRFGTGFASRSCRMLHESTDRDSCATWASVLACHVHTADIANDWL